MGLVPEVERTSSGMTAFHIALSKGFDPIVKYFIDAYPPKEESYEELPELKSFQSDPVNDVRDKPRSLRIVRALQDLGMKECAAYAWWRSLEIVGKASIPDVSVKDTIGGLTRGKC